MENKIKEFIKADAMSAVEADAETAGAFICESIGWEITKRSFIAFRFPLENGNYNVFPCYELATDERLWQVHEAEKAVIEKVGGFRYIFALVCLTQKTPIDVGDFYWQITPEDLESVATASAHQRIAAMLSALAEVEIGE